MKKVKKLLTILLSLAFTVFFSVGVLVMNKSVVKADNQPLVDVNTKMYMPASRLEFYDLKSPQAICYQDGYLIITEYHKDELGNETNKLIVYNPSSDSYEVNLSPSLINVTCVAKYGNYLLLLIDSAIFTLPLDNVTTTPTDTGIRVGKSFSVNKNAVVTHTSSGIYKYNMVDDGNGLKFTKIDENGVTGVLSCLLTDSGDFYYFVTGTGLIRRKPDGGETVIYRSTPDFDFTPAYMAEIGEFVYFSTPSGIYKVKKEENSLLTKIIPVSNEFGLGVLNSPAGITVKDGKLLVADTTLNCIQEIDPSVDAFTEFAVTTESTADYRLTNSASNLSLSENYLYALDDATQNDDSESVKRLVKISLSESNKSYEKIDLSTVYGNENEKSNLIYSASDTHVAISYNDKVTIYKQIEGKPITLEKVKEFDKRATSSYYLDNDFYFTNYYIDVYNANASYVQIYKITMPTLDNELLEPKLSIITENEVDLDFSKAITGYPIDLTVDIFGNAYVLTTDNLDLPTKYNIHRYYGKTVTSTEDILTKPLGIESDFAGNVYAVMQDKTIVKHTFVQGEDTEVFKINAVGGFNVKDIALNYRGEMAYFLSDACILTTTDNALKVQNLSRVSADTVKPNELQETQRFITVDKNAKLFKVTIGDYFVENDKNHFKTIEPISNPNTARVYLIIAEVDNDYYLISYSQKFTALVKKSSVLVNSSTSLVPNENYETLGIVDAPLNNEKFIISNQVNLFSRPVFDTNYKIAKLNKNDEVLAVKQVTFNGKTYILVSNADGVKLGYIPKGYLIKNNITPNQTIESSHDVITGNGKQRSNTIFMVLIIAFTLTATALLLEYKLLFKNKDL